LNLFTYFYKSVSDTCWFVTLLQYCSGGELFDYIVSKSRLSEKESQQIMSALIQVLAYLHSNGFAHRDLKPENILFDKFHRIKLIDFGLAAQSKVSKHFYMICM
jgi:maternal embryonic leucine zipper kinase